MSNEFADLNLQAETGGWIHIRSREKPTQEQDDQQDQNSIGKGDKLFAQKIQQEARERCEEHGLRMELAEISSKEGEPNVTYQYKLRLNDNDHQPTDNQIRTFETTYLENPSEPLLANFPNSQVQGSVNYNAMLDDDDGGGVVGAVNITFDEKTSRQFLRKQRYWYYFFVVFFFGTLWGLVWAVRFLSSSLSQ